MAMNILKNEGLLGLYAGVTPAVARHIPYTGFRAIGYEYIRAFFCGSAPKDVRPTPIFCRSLSMTLCPSRLLRRAPVS